MPETAATSNDSTTTAETEETLEETQKPNRTNEELLTTRESGVGDPGGDPTDPKDTPPGG